MKRLILSLWFTALTLGSAALAAGFEDEISAISNAVTSSVTASGKTKIAVLDFTDLDGNRSEIGRFFAEELSVTLVTDRKGFAVLDRSNLKSILQEHKLTAAGLVNPENAKKLGQFAGVDAIVIGNMTLLKSAIRLSVKVIATDTAEIVGAKTVTIAKSDEIQQLIEHGAATAPASDTTETAQSDTPPPARNFSAPNAGKKLKDFSVELISFHALSDGTGSADFLITNTSKNRIIGLAANTRRDPYNPNNDYSNPFVCGSIGDDRGDTLYATGVEGLPIFSLNWKGLYYAPTGVDMLRNVCAEKNWNKNFGDQYEWATKIAFIQPGETLNTSFKFGPLADQRGQLVRSRIGKVFTLKIELITTNQQQGDESELPVPRLESIYLGNIVPAKPSP